ncbi:PH domain-containing protein [Streptomyces sp. NPDC052095]|uniref:PH domain-containing protein n=1 Tax=unclassified Streptomyces TaxID=2593676 RepID=UPI00344F8EFF
MRKRRGLRPLLYFLTGCVCLPLTVVMVVGTIASRNVAGLLPVVALGFPGVVLTFRAPVFGVRFGPDGLRYSGLLNARSYAWADIREVRVAVLQSTVHWSDVPELVLASGGTDQLHMLSGHSFGKDRNKRVARLVAELEAARAAAS